MTSLREVEAFIAAGRKIRAIKEIRAMTGMGLLEAKNTVEHFEAHGSWPAGLERSAEVAVPMPATPAPQPQPSRAASTSSAIQAVADRLGYAPHVHLDARARRSGQDGRLVMLREQSCFVTEHRGQWTVSLVVAHASVHQVAIDDAARTILCVAARDHHERFELDPADAEAALALFRVFGP